MTHIVHQRVVRFGAFEADLRTQELRKHGLRIKLPRQSFQVLEMLLDRPGELVSREELQKALWPADTFVDFENGLNNAVKRIRGALGDSADSPRFVETLPRLGYRFISTIDPNQSLPRPKVRKFRRSSPKAAQTAAPMEIDLPASAIRLANQVQMEIALIRYRPSHRRLIAIRRLVFCGKSV